MAEKLDLPRPSALAEMPFGGTFSILGDEPAGEGQDRLGFGRFADRLAKRLLSSVEHTPFTVGVLGDWGQGKTTVMRMLQTKLQAEGCPTVWFEPWKYNDRDEVWKGLALTLVREIRKNDNLVREIHRKSWPLKRLLGDFLWSKLIGETWSAKLVDAVTAEPWSAAALHEMESTLDNLFRYANPAAKGRSLVLFVDDLDRCLPETARSVLEAVKLVLARKGVITVLGIAEGELARAVQAAYAESMKGSGGTVDPRWGYRYIEKIIQMPFPLPQVSEVSFDSYVGHCLDESGVGALLGERQEWRGLIREACGGNLRNVKRLLNHFISEWDKARANVEALSDEGRGGKMLEVRPARVAFVLLLAFGFPDFYLHVRRSALRDLILRYQAYFTSHLDKESAAELLQDPGQEFHLDSSLAEFFHLAMRSASEDGPLVREFRDRLDLLPYLQFGRLPAEEAAEEHMARVEGVPERAIDPIAEDGHDEEEAPVETAAKSMSVAGTGDPPAPEVPSERSLNAEESAGEPASSTAPRQPPAETPAASAQEPPPSPAPAALLAVDEASGLMASGRYEEGEHKLRRALRRAVREGDEAGLIVLQRSLGEALMFLGRFEEAAERLRSSIRNALRLKDDQAALETHPLLVEVLTKMGSVDGALAVASEGEGLAAKLGDRFSRGRILALRAGILEHEGLSAEAMEDREEVLFLAEQLGHPTFKAQALLGLGRVLVERGKFEAAEADLKRASELAAKIGLLDVEADAVELSVRVALRTGNEAVARERQGRLVELRRSQGDPSALATALFELAWYVASSGALDPAKDFLGEGQRILGAEAYDHAQLTAVVHALELLDGPGEALRFLRDQRSRDLSLLANTDLDMLADALNEAAGEAKQP